ncbi:MAG: methionyl-tRNA formyltransferase [Gammaproteobacteria bacterium]|nr:methionyl-tRNA formyltransferase [Gammaproteobacteria bacterium]
MSEGLRVAFAGTPAVAATLLQAVLESSHRVIGVYTQPDRPAGRGRKLRPGPVKTVAEQAGIPVLQPPRFDDQACRDLRALDADVMLVYAYGLLLPGLALTIPRLGCINVHASLLPRWRGAAPVQRAILAGDTRTGICIMRMVEALDAGPVLYREACGIPPGETAVTLHARLAHLAGARIGEVLGALAQNRLVPEPQAGRGVTYAKKVDKSEAGIDWSESASLIARKVRAFNDWPVAYTWLGEHRVRVWEAHVAPGDTAQAPGTVLDARAGIEVATGAGILGVTALQLPGARCLPARDFLNAHDLQGRCFSSGMPG